MLAAGCWPLVAPRLERKVPSFVHHPRLGVQLVGATEMPVEQEPCGWVGPSTSRW